MEQPVQAPANTVGIVGLCMVAAATLMSPTGFYGVTLVVLVPLGFGGLALCAASLFWRQRWPGVVGLTVGLLCIAGWVVFFAWAFVSVQRGAAAHGMTIAQSAQVRVAAVALTETAEAQRQADGSAAPVGSLSLGSLTPAMVVDPWGSAYRYVLTTTPRGFTFVSDGPDRLAGTADDIDLLSLQGDGMFPLPPISSKAGK